MAITTEHVPFEEVGNYLSDMEFLAKTKSSLKKLTMLRSMDMPGTNEVEFKKGRVFMLRNELKLSAYVICYDNRDYGTPTKIKNRRKKKQYIEAQYYDQLGLAREFVADLSLVSQFSYISDFVVGSDTDQTGYGKKLFESVKSFYRRDNKGGSQSLKGKYDCALISTLIDESDQAKFDLFRNLGFVFIDFFLDEFGKLHYRAVKMLDNGTFIRAMNSENLVVASNTFIPIQLNMATNSINGLINRLGAEITWTAFFLEDTTLTNTYDLKTIYNGYYNTLLSLKDSDYHKGVDVLKSIVRYIEKRDQGIAKTITKPIEKKGFNFFLINDDVNRHTFDSFASEVKISTKNLSVDSMVNESKLRLKTDYHQSRLDSILFAEIHEWDDLLENLRKDHQEEKHIYGAILRARAKEHAIDETSFSQLKMDKLNELALAPVDGMNETEGLEEQGLADKRRLNKWRKNAGLSTEEIALWKKWVDLHLRLEEMDTKRNLHSSNDSEVIWCHAVIPMTFMHGVSGLMFSFVVKKEPDEDREKASSLLNDLAYTISNAYSKNMFNILLKLKNHLFQQYSTKSALSSIMTRNMSHNYGSHVLPRISSVNSIRSFPDWDSARSPNSAPVKVLEELAQFNTNLRARMDFLADLSTSDPVTSVPRKLNNGIIKKFNNEDVIKRFISGTDIQDVVVKYKNRIDKLNRDVIVQVPNGNLGNQAFYTIIENIVRNASKHGNKKDPSNENIRVHVEVNQEENNNRFYSVIIYDTVTKKEDNQLLVNQINSQYIDAKVLEGNGNIRKTGWGLLEMKVAAAYLRKVSIENIDQEFELPLLKCITNGEYGIAYKLYLKKYREHFFLIHKGYERGDTTDLLYELARSNEADKNLLQQGIRVSTKDRLIIKKNEILTHDFLVILGDGALASEMMDNKLLPLRQVVIEPNCHDLMASMLLAIREDNDKAKAELTLRVWDDWIRRYCARKVHDFDMENLVLLSDNGGEVDVTSFKSTEILKNEFSGTIIFDNHNHSFDKIGVTSGDLKDFDFRGSSYYEPFGSKAPTGLFISALKSEARGPLKEKLFNELYEAAITKVIVLDERIQREIGVVQVRPGEGYESLTGFERLELANILIPPPETIDLHLNDINDSLMEWLAHHLSPDREKPDFLVIHLGIIDRIWGTGADKISDFIEAMVRKHSIRIEVVIVSGRGKPQYLPENVLFLHYSNVSKYIIEEPSKYHLCKVLFSSRSRIENV